MKTFMKFFDLGKIISTIIWTGITIFFYVMIVRDFQMGCYVGDSLVQWLSITLLVMFTLVLIMMYYHTIKDCISGYKWYRNYRLSL